ncbi:MAG: adenylate cyclase, partial [Actinomycetota bacterium]
MFLSVLVGATGIAVALPGPDIPGLSVGAVLTIVAFGVATIAVVLVLGRAWPPEAFTAMVLVLGPVVMLAVWFAGPDLGVSAAVIPAMAGGMLLFHRRRAALLGTTELFVLYGVILAFGDGYPRPVARWILVAGFTAASSLLQEWVFRQLKVLADRDRASTAALEVAHTQLADANQELETRVTEQVDEIERLGRLRRFLSPQVADTVMS